MDVVASIFIEHQRFDSFSSAGRRSIVNKSGCWPSNSTSVSYLKEIALIKTSITRNVGH